MSTGFYVAMSAQVGLEKRLDAIANNIANMNTAGYRATGVQFQTVMNNAGDGEPVAYVSTGQSYITRSKGPITLTGNSLDVAVDGDGWLALKSPDGTVYTRDGRLHLNELGELQSVKGYPVLDNGGSPITLDPSAGPVEIGEDGRISQGGKLVGSIGLSLIPDEANLKRYDNSAVIPDKPVSAVEDMTTNSIRQGYIEGSNVNPIMEMSRLIETSRAFDNASAAMQQSDTTSADAIKTLAPS
jgi:flagellar basal-body rod protein FlgF